MLTPPQMALLAGSQWFARLPPALRSAVAARLRPAACPAGRALFHQGDPPSGLHVLLSGQLHVTGADADGAASLMGILRPGDWTGFLAALDGEPHAFTAVAVEDSRAACLPPDAIRDLFERDVETYRHLVAPELLIARRNYRFYLEIHCRPPMRRIAQRLMELGRWPYSVPTGPLSPLDHVSQDGLAAATRLSRQTVNACLRELEGAGLVKVGYGRIALLDPAGLATLAGGAQIDRGA